MPRGADLVLVGANVFTGSQRRRWAKSLAIQDGRILAVGTEGQVSRAADRGTRRLDLHGRIVVPGFIDAHTHVADSAGELGWTRLDGTRSMTEAIAKPHDRFGAGPAVIERNLPRIARMAHRLGITSVHDVVSIPAWTAYQRLRRAGRLRLRVSAWVPTAAAESFARAGIQSGLGDEWLRMGGVKVFSDGSLGAFTAFLDSPYEGRGKDRGSLIHPPTELRSILETAHRAGLRTATHAIGDAASRLVAETLAEVQEENPREPMRHRIEHFELPDEETLRLTRDAGLIASCQPNFVGQWSGPGDVYEMRLGSDRLRRNNPFRQIARLGIPLCFGSDGMPYGPLYGIHWAVNGCFDDQCLSPEDAFRAYSARGAYASFEETRRLT